MFLGARVENFEKMPFFGIFTPNLTVFGLPKKKLGRYAQNGIFSPKSTFSYMKLYESTLRTLYFG